MERILVIGSGAREHAMVWKIAQDSPNLKLFCAPGNPGIAEIAECIPIPVNCPVDLADFAQDNNIDFTIVGPEAALASGVVDEFKNRNLAIFGSTAEAAQIETSKVWAKWLMDKYNIPTAKFKTFNPQNLKEAKDYIKNQGVPIVIKEDGIAAGKGASVVFDLPEAL
ncbi:MAG: phosphoribosylamine--glycine ligase, partial [Candidatus Daviesbacteria bacterium]|nr:phosphoribosylamine--glycine ligase [Candidatus Daviesbacteria bacterium]